MNYAHAFWSKPLLNNKFHDLQIGLAITLVDYSVSVDFLHKNGYEITLYTDKEGAELLSEIPYDKVVIVENDITDNWNFAASIKFVALQHMKLGDCLIDGDLFLTKGRVYAEIAASSEDFICSFFEAKDKKILENYKPVFDILNNTESVEDIYKDNSDFKGYYNTSFIRINNKELLDKYINQYKKHLALLENVQFEKGIWPDIIIEQLNLTNLVKDKYSVKCLIPNFGKEGQEELAQKLGYTHLGATKKQLHNKLVQLLSKQNPELFSKISNYIKKYGENYLHKTNECAG